MALFVSWIEHENEIYFITKHDLKTKKGKKTLKYSGKFEDVIGHEFIRRYYNFRTGLNRECPHFSSPLNFPPIIAEAIVNGDFEGLGIPYEILTAEAKNKYEELADKHWPVFDKRRHKVFWDLLKDPKNRIEVWR